MTLRQELANVLNKHSAENGSNTPDYVLADFLLVCLEAFDKATKTRDNWYKKDKEEDSKFHLEIPHE